MKRLNAGLSVVGFVLDIAIALMSIVAICHIVSNRKKKRDL